VFHSFREGKEGLGGEPFPHQAVVGLFLSFLFSFMACSNITFLVHMRDLCDKSREVLFFVFSDIDKRVGGIIEGRVVDIV
jgi:hypothetical protein